MLISSLFFPQTYLFTHPSGETRNGRVLFQSNYQATQAEIFAYNKQPLSNFQAHFGKSAKQPQAEMKNGVAYKNKNVYLFIYLFICLLLCRSSTKDVWHLVAHVIYSIDSGKEKLEVCEDVTHVIPKLNHLFADINITILQSGEIFNSLHFNLYKDKQDFLAGV